MSEYGLGASLDRRRQAVHRSNSTLHLTSRPSNQALGWFQASKKADPRISRFADALSYFRPVCYAVQNRTIGQFELGKGPCY